VFGTPPDIKEFRRWALIPFAFPRVAVETGVIELHSPGLQQRNFVGTEDIADAIDIWMRDEAAPTFSVINPVGKESMTVFGFAQMCAEIAREQTGRDCRVVWQPATTSEPNIFEYTTQDNRFVGRSDIRQVIARLSLLLWRGMADEIDQAS
jgi:nucleoside-diphosphate-sugar epimerase